MIRKWRPWLGLFLLLSLGTPSAVHGQDASRDYARVVAPDVAPATRFLGDVMGCQPIDATSGDGRRAMLECAEGSVIEIVQGSAPATAVAPLRLHADNVDMALAGLRSRKITVIGHAATRSKSAASQLVTLDVMTPWGQTLELVGHGSSPRANPADQLAAD